MVWPAAPVARAVPSRPDVAALRRALDPAADHTLHGPMTATCSPAGAAVPTPATRLLPGGRDHRPRTGERAGCGKVRDPARRSGPPGPDNGPVTTTVADPASTLPPDEVRGTFLAWCASLAACTLDQAAEMPARALAVRTTGASPEHPDAAPVWHLLATGPGDVATRIAASLHAAVRVGTPAHTNEIQNGRPHAHDTTGTTDYDAIVVATPAPRARDLPRRCPDRQAPVTHLASYDYVPTTVIPRRDPVHMPPDRAHWSTTSVTVDDPWAESTVWLGPVLGADIFKSRVTHRDEPQDVIARAEYRQPRPTVAGAPATHALAAHQGRHGVYFAGSHPAAADSQEAAACSTIDAVRPLIPRSPRGGPTAVDATARAHIRQESTMMLKAASRTSTISYDIRSPLAGLADELEGEGRDIIRLHPDDPTESCPRRAISSRPRRRRPGQVACRANAT